ncbi:MobF family relaxase [Salmonella enterica subsp. enterica serovar Sandiego]
MLSISSIKGDAGYYSHEDNYYASGSLDSRWMGEGAEKLGLKGEVASADMDAVRQGRLPDGSDLSRMVDGVNKHRSGYDLTFSAPKSVSVMALVGEDRRFIEAHNRAVAVVMKEVEQLVSARITQEGKTETVLTGSMVAALYNHDTSRDLDPQVHTHALVFNATFADEKWRSLASDTRMKTGFSENLYATKIVLGNLYRSALREDIESMGFETVAAGKHGLWELKDVPVDIFSSRSQAIREAAGPDASAKSRDVAALDTRQAKAWADPDLLKADWRRRLTDEKFDIGHYISQAQARVEITGSVVAGQGGMRAPGQPGIVSSGEAADELVQKAVSDTISALSDKKVQFTWSEMLAGTVSRLPSAPGLFEQARAGIEAAIEGQRLIPLDREQQQLTEVIRDTRREAGELVREQVTLRVLEPVWLDSKTRHQRDNYRPGMVMEQWDAEKKTMTRHTIDRVAEATNSLVLQGEDGTRLTLKVTQLDGSWSLYRSRTLEVSEGDRVRALGRELKGAIKAKEQFTVAGLENGAVRLRSGDRELRLPTERAVKLTHDYVEGTGAGTSASRTVLAAVGPRGLNKQALNALAQSGSDIRIYTPLAPEQAARKVESVSAVRLASDQVRQSTGEANLDTAIQASRERLMSDAEQAVNLAIPRAQQGQVYLSELTLLAEAVKSGQPLADVRAEIARQVDSGALIKLDSVAGAGNRVLVPRVAYEMEKTIIRHIAEGKDAVQPLMALTPASVLSGLTTGQREATRTVLENTDRFMAIQGYAGVGKTTQFRAVMGALNTLSESVRPQVIGLGPTHRAVHEMREAGVEARTLASFLSETRLAIQAGETPDFRNVLFLTDESSMVGNRDMAELYQLVAAGGGRMVSSGDTAQLQAISTGLPFRLVQQRSAIDTVVMQEIVRQTPALRPAIESIIAGQVEISLRQVDDVTPQQVPRQPGAWVPDNSVMEIRTPKKEQDQVQDTPVAGEQTLTPEQLALVRTDIIEAIRDDWMGRTPEAQQQTLVVAELNADRHAINDAIHTARHEKGDTGAEERTFTVLEPLRVPDNALRAAETFAEYTGAVAMMNERYWTVAEVDTQDAVVTLRNADGESVLISPQQNTAQDISLFTPRDLTISQGDRVRFTRSDTDRGYVANSLWEVAGFTDDGAIRFRQGDQEKIVDPQAMTEDRHIDLAYALTVYGVQGASERFAIALTGTEGGRKRMASLESTYVTLSRAKEHVQVYTDDLAGWSADARHSNAGQTAHDLLHQKSDHESDTGNRLLATASRLDKTALGRRVLAENGLEGETMARFIAAGKKYPSPYVALPAWTRHGKAAGALLTEIRIEDDGMRVVLSDESRLRGGEDAQFAGLQASRNGQTLIADDAQTALRLAQENPESGVVIRLYGEERLLNAARLTGGRITEPDEVERTVRSVAEAESAAKAEDPITLPPDEQQKLAEAQEKAARELAEQARQELLPALPGTEGDKPDPLLSASDERRLRDGTERETRELDEAVREAVAEGREPRQQVRDQMQRTEREWVVNVPEKEIELEKTLGGD